MRKTHKKASQNNHQPNLDNQTNFMVDKILSHEFHHPDVASENQVTLKRAGTARKPSALSTHRVDDLEMIDNFYSRYTSMTGEENPHNKQPNYKLTTMIKNPNALTAEHS